MICQTLLIVVPWAHVMPLLICHQESWPSGVDWGAIAIFLALTIAAPTLGYWFMVMDIRAYFRAMKRALVCVTKLVRPAATPNWARRYTPACLRGLGLELPCTEKEIKQAYRRLAEQLHPDRGGDPKRFLKLQQDVKQALEFIGHSTRF